MSNADITANPNAKTDGQKRQAQEALIAKRTEEDRVAAEAKAKLAGGTGMISEKKPDTERKLEALPKDRLTEASAMVLQYVATAPAGTQVDDLRQPAFWANVGERLRPWTEIMVRADDGLWYARLMVLEAGRNWAKVHIERVEFLTTAEVALTQADAMSPYEIKHRGPHSQWSVLRRSDQAVVHEGSATIEGAVQWLKGRLQADR